MLTKEEVEAILKECEDQKKVPAAKASKGEVKDEAFINARMLALKQKNPGTKVFIQHPQTEKDKNNTKTNDAKPFYVAKIQKVENGKAFLILTDEESKEVDGVPPAYLQPGFSIGVENTLEYSEMTEGAGQQDMVDIDELNKATLLYNLANRYNNPELMEIYTWVGPILLVLNPFKGVPHYATPGFNDKYRAICDPKLQPIEEKNKLLAHTNSISAMAYAKLKSDGIRQAIVISGESGSGKTEAAKIAMKMLVLLTKPQSVEPDPVSVPGEVKEKVMDIGDRIQQCNPILEGFGNSKTSRNDNSSRFGKYVKMFFDKKEDKCYGAKVSNYLLEKSRIIMVAKKERGYHIFYFMLRGADDEILKKTKLWDPKTSQGLEHMKFKYLEGGGDYINEVERAKWETHDKEGFQDVQTKMNELKFEDHFQDAVWKINAAVLHIGQIKFDDSSFDGVDSGKRGKIENPDQVKLVADLLGIEDIDYFTRALLEDMNEINKEVTWTCQTLEKCNNNRDTLAKQIFYQMFDWLVKKMNLNIQPDVKLQGGQDAFNNKAKTIGLLDIFGFENFADPLPNKTSGNNFEQLCINYVNEKLHKLYISAIFEAEKKELKEEGLGDKADHIKFDTTVQQILDLIDGQGKGKQPIGIFRTVDDWAQRSQSTTKPQEIANAFNNQKYSDFYYKQYLAQKGEDVTKPKNLCEEAKDLYFTIDKGRQERKFQFRIKHSAEPVWYDLSEFVIRDIDKLPRALEDCMADKSGKWVSLIYQVLLDDKEKKQEANNKKTIWGSFQLQMADLMKEMAESLLKMGDADNKDPVSGQEPTGLHFIRCIKPRPKPVNDDDRPGLFVYTMTLQQITYMGVLESVKLKQDNFPFRKKFQEFYKEYELISDNFALQRYEQMDKDVDFSTLAKTISTKSMQGLGEDFYFNGTTKILMMPEAKKIFDACKSKQSASRIKAADFLKRSFCTFGGAKNTDRQRATITAVQQKYKILYQKKQKGYMAEFKVNFDDAITKYKDKKMRVYQIRSVAVFKDVLAKHIFRNQLDRAMCARETVAKTSFNAAYLQRITKYMISNILATRVVHNAFTIARDRVNGQNVWHVQRAFRGFALSSQPERKESMCMAIKEKKSLKFEISAKKIQKRSKGLIVRRRIATLRASATIIQSYFRMRWARQVYLMIKRNVMILQRYCRRYMARRDQIRIRLKSYLTQEFTVINNVREMEDFQLFGSDNDPDLLKQHSPYGNKKICLFNRVVDMHVLTDLSDVYSTPWAAQWMQIYKDGIEADKPIMQLSVGASHTVATSGKGQLYVWGWNDNGQCTIHKDIVDEIVVKGSGYTALIDLERQMMQEVPRRENQKPPSFSIKARQILTVEDRTFVLTQDTNELIAWGGNEKGELGLGHYSDVHVPTKLDFFSKPGHRVCSIAGGGDLTLACTENGDSYAWPFVKQGQKYSNPVRMPFSVKINISRVSCGYNFGFFISSQGLVYSVGKDNSDGQLGLGHVYPNDIPELVSCFKEAGERIDSIECGFRHSIARSTLGKVYTWGWNKFGQLGHGSFDSELSPRLLNLGRGKLNKDKAVQIAAGYSHTVIMTTTNNFEILHFGTSGSMSNQTTPIPLNLSGKLSSMFPKNDMMKHATHKHTDFAVVKISCTWSKCISLTNLMIADLRAVNEPKTHTKLQNAIKQLALQWDQREIMPPWIEPISGFFSANLMRKPNNSQQPQSGVNTKASNPLNKKPKQTESKNTYSYTVTDKIMGRLSTSGYRSQAHNPLTQSVLSESPNVPSSGWNRY